MRSQAQVIIHLYILTLSYLKFGVFIHLRRLYL